MDISVVFRYDPERNIIFTEDHGEIKTEEDVDEFFAEYIKCFKELGKRVYVVCNIDNLLVHAKIAEYYGEKARTTIDVHMLGLARWGTNDWARMTVRNTSLRVKMMPNIYDTLDEAIQAIEKMKKEKASGEL